MVWCCFVFRGECCALLCFGVMHTAICFVLRHGVVLIWYGVYYFAVSRGVVCTVFRVWGGAYCVML